MESGIIKKKNILYISLLAPYDKVDHAGGKVHNFYLKEMKSCGLFNIELLSMCWKREEKDLDLDRYGISNKIYVLDKNRAHKLVRKSISAFSYFNPFDKYGNLLLDYERYQYKKLIRNFFKKIRRDGLENPDIIILQWTQIIFLIDYVKKFFPKSKIIAIEEDVSFLSFYRRIDLCRNKLQKRIAVYRFQKVKKLELEVLEKADIIINNNHKDFLLLEKEGIEKEKLRELPIYFKSYDYIQRTEISHDILFYGAMSRPENYNSAIWFIENVMPLLYQEDIRFVIVGSRPNKALLEKQNEKIIVTGYVESVEPYFANCLCMVAPLVLGAGVKVKILEAMSSGIPVLTNSIGIEGIYAKKEVHFDFCTTPQEYATAIKRIIELKQITNVEAQKYVRENYDLKNAFQKFIRHELMEEGN